MLATDFLDSVHTRAAQLQADGLAVSAFQADLNSRPQVEALAAEAIRQFGRIDILVNVAGKSVPPRLPFLEMTGEYWNLVLDRNLKTTYLCCKVVLPEMVKQRYGKVVNISSYPGVKYAYRYSAAYCASKGAVSGLTKALALKFGEYNINVNAVLSGDIWVNAQPWTPEIGRRELGIHDPFLSPRLPGPAIPKRSPMRFCFSSRMNRALSPEWSCWWTADGPSSSLLLLLRRRSRAPGQPCTAVPCTGRVSRWAVSFLTHP